MHVSTVCSEIARFSENFKEVLIQRMSLHSECFEKHRHVMYAGVILEGGGGGLLETL